MSNKCAKQTGNQRAIRKVDIIEILSRTSLSQYNENNLPPTQAPDYKEKLTNPDPTT